MKIVCNGKEYSVAGKTRIAEFIRALGFAPETVAVEYNGRIVDRHECDSLILEEGAKLELIRFVGGGARSC